MKSVRDRLGITCTALLFAVATIVPVALISNDVAAQAITSSITGTVLTADGQPASGAAATVTDSRDGRVQRATADARGIIHFRSVSPGGPYTVRVSSEGSEPLVITDLYTNVAGTSSFTVTLAEADEAIEEIVTTAAQIQTITTASGPSSSFSLQEITDMPSTQRQIRDVIRVDPRISIGETGDGGDQSGAISCLGGSSRTNSFTVDGVRATDAFGLNLSGNLSRFTFPIPFDTVEAAAVEFSPVSAEYGQFSGCNVNVVTKSGGNEFHGGGFFLLNDDGMTGENIGNSTFPQGTFERENYGFDVGGPIIRDKLFFYTAYEKFETASVNPVGSADDTSFPRNDTIFTTAELNQIRDILINQYDRDPGEAVRNLPVESERVFVRFDWNINDDHRLEANYASVEEATTIRDDIGGGRGEYTFSDNFHARGSDSETYALRLYSDWTDNFSTEFRYSTQEVTDIQNPVGGGEAQDPVPKPRIAISGFGVASEFFGQEFVSGPGTFRSANQLATEKDQIKLKFDYQAGDHLITGGYEWETVDVFNLFIINATGTVFFDSIADLAAGNAYEIISANSFTGNPNDAAAAYSRDINAVFLQDKWDINDSMQLIYGVRYDWYSAGNLPLENPNYFARYGLDNQVSYDDLDVVQPRIGFNWTLPDKYGDTRLSLGYGVFSGNDPTVWFSNAYQNFGGTLGRATATGSALCDGSELQVLSSGSFSGIPSCVLDTAQNQALQIAGTVNATDPGFDLPTVNRFSLGLEHNTNFDSDFLSDWNVQLDIIVADFKHQVDWLDLSLNEVGTAPDGRPLYSQVDPLLPGCNATFNGPRQGYSNVDPALCTGGNSDIFFTNRPGDGGSTFTTSIQASKLFSWSGASTLNLTLGYSYNESEVGNAGQSFTASEQFNAVVTDNLWDIPIGASLRNTPQNFVISATYSNEFWSGYRTSISAFFQRRAGAPISATFFGDPYTGDLGDTGGDARNLLYVPTDASDPLVQFDPGFDTDAFFNWVDRNDLKRGAIQKKGRIDEAWQTDLDIRFQQEIPFFGRAKAKFYIDIENILNMFNDEWGIKRYINTTDIQSAVGVVSAGIDTVNNQYVFESFTEPTRVPDTFDSLYRIQVGIRADF